MSQQHREHWNSCHDLLQFCADSSFISSRRLSPYHQYYSCLFPPLFPLCFGCVMLIRILNSVLRQMGHLNHCFIGSLELLFRLLFSLVFSPVQTDATLLANNSQHCWIYILSPFAHPVACCWVLLGVVAQGLKPIKLLATCKRTQQLPSLWANNFGSCCVCSHVVWQKCALFTVDRFYSRWGIWLPWCSHIPSDRRRYPNALCASARNKFCPSSGKHCPYSKEMP